MAGAIIWIAGPQAVWQVTQSYFPRRHAAAACLGLVCPPAAPCLQPVACPPCPACCASRYPAAPEAEVCSVLSPSWVVLFLLGLLVGAGLIGGGVALGTLAGRLARGSSEQGGDDVGHGRDNVWPARRSCCRPGCGAHDAQAGPRQRQPSRRVGGRPGDAVRHGAHEPCEPAVAARTWRPRSGHRRSRAGLGTISRTLLPHE
ncbi:unnamed protein product [Prorocentrum cordatum]|uniref:Uncharacterized protein n=1 Tax=Prorocentrum cordatum TaxID=2364126 RepID=A0ABN9XTU3_9DINO|nr:unnamed protein product [Polarella glacialis]